MRFLDPDQSQRFEHHLAGVCRQFLAEVRSPPLAERLLAYVQAGGKRIRPHLVLWTYTHAVEGDRPTPKSALDVAAAWELFHAFLLIHDDIIDGSDCRRGLPALHRQLQSLDSDSPRFGVNLGIVAGDLLYAWTNRILAGLDVPATAFRDLHRLFARIATTTGLGQVEDVLRSHEPIAHRSEATLLQEYHWKTAAYTFEGPMLSAAILAGLPDAAHAAVSRFALCLGQAYQMQNDLLDLIRPVGRGSDLVEGEHTYTLLKAREFLCDGDRERFDHDFAEVVASDGRAIELAESVRRRMLDTPAVAATHDRIQSLLGDCLADTAALPPCLVGAMTASLGALRKRYFVTD
ncbi:MAG: polyprenyl synthetase family protein [Tepidisphaeraceae bacterium]